jgi:hypothetical protein
LFRKRARKAYGNNKWGSKKELPSILCTGKSLKLPSTKETKRQNPRLQPKDIKANLAFYTRCSESEQEKFTATTTNDDKQNATSMAWTITAEAEATTARKKKTRKGSPEDARITWPSLYSNTCAVVGLGFLAGHKYGSHV